MVSCFDPNGFSSGFDLCAGPIVEGVGGGRYKLIQRERRKLRFRTTAITELQHLLEERQRGRAYIQFTLAAKTPAISPVGHKPDITTRTTIPILHKLNILRLNTMFVNHQLNEKSEAKPRELLNIRYLLFKLKQKLGEL